MRHRTDLYTKVKSHATLIRIEADSGLIGMGAALGTPPIVAAIVEHELAAECVGWANDDAGKLAEGLKAALAQINVAKN